MISAVIPCYRVKRHIVDVVQDLLPRVDRIFVVDDCCPEQSGHEVIRSFSDEPRVTVIFHDLNKGVGGAVVTGYKAALAARSTIIIKVDGDGQMDLDLLESLLSPLIHGGADYAKGNRFFSIGDLAQMPTKRLIGNVGLSFINKASSGYWNIMDPTNGYTAIHSTALQLIDLDRLSQRYFFESDMLFRLGLVRAVVKDVSMPARYGDETSSLKITRVMFDFPGKLAANFLKRFFYGYLLRDLNSASMEALLGGLLIAFALIDGIWQWTISYRLDEARPLGTIMIVALAAIMGTQFLLAALAFDIANVPKEPLQSMDGLRAVVEARRRKLETTTIAGRSTNDEAGTSS